MVSALSASVHQKRPLVAVMADFSTFPYCTQHVSPVVWFQPSQSCSSAESTPHRLLSTHRCHASSSNVLHRRPRFGYATMTTTSTGCASSVTYYSISDYLCTHVPPASRIDLHRLSLELSRVVLVQSDSIGAITAIQRRRLTCQNVFQVEYNHVGNIPRSTTKFSKSSRVRSKDPTKF